MTLHEYWKVIRHRWLLIVACLLVAAGIAFLVTPASGDTTKRVGSYTATATLLVGSGAQPGQVNQGGSFESASLGRVMLFVTTGEIPKRAAAALGFQGDPAVLASGLKVEPVEQAQAVTIAATASDGQRAADVANTFAREAVRYFDEGHQGTGNAKLTVLQEATPIPNEGRAFFTLPSGRWERTALAAVLGLLVGFGIALILDRLDSRLRTRQEVHEALHLPVVAQVPRLRRADRVPGKLAVVTDPLGEYANGYRAARTALMHLPGQRVAGEWGPGDADATAPKAAQVVLVTSAFESEGKTTSVANLAASFAETGQSVLVLDADLRSPDTHRQFDVPQGAGISDYLVQPNQGSIEPLIRPTSVPGVFIVTAGTRLDHPAALSSRLGSVIEQARALADVVVVDTAPLLAASDVFDILPLVDTVLLVVRSGRLTEPAGNRVSELLGRFKVPVTGAIIIGAPARRSEGYGSKYGYGYGEDPKKRQKKEARAAVGKAAAPAAPTDQRMSGLAAVPSQGASAVVSEARPAEPVSDADTDTHVIPAVRVEPLAQVQTQSGMDRSPELGHDPSPRRHR